MTRTTYPDLGESAILTGITVAPAVRFVQEGSDTVVQVEMTPRDWDVLDPGARDAAAKLELGVDFDYYRRRRDSGMWFVNPDRNTAGLCIYRPRQRAAA